MNTVERYGLDDFNEIPASAPEEEADNPFHDNERPELEQHLTFTPYPQFAATEEATAEALLGSSTETLLPADGMLLMYGDGGAGKTTLTIDAACHLAAGTPWCGIGIERASRLALIENEGPRGKYRQMLAEKQEAWQGDAYQHNITVLEEPWTRFTLRNPHHLAGLAAHVDAADIDILIMGPLVTLGMVGGGTPDEISEFEELLRRLRELTQRPLALWIVHHENKQGDVSGAWERVPDTLAHVQARGNGHTRLVWRKARWSSENHGLAVDLVWAEGRSYELYEKPVRDHHAEVLEAYQQDDQWRTAKEVSKLLSMREGDAKQALSDLTERGDMVFQIGPPGRHFNTHCWRLQCAPEAWAHTGAHQPLTLEEGVVRHTHTPQRGVGVRAHTTEGAPSSAPHPRRTPTSDPDDGIPW